MWPPRERDVLLSFCEAADKGEEPAVTDVRLRIKRGLAWRAVFICMRAREENKGGANVDLDSSAHHQPVDLQVELTCDVTYGTLLKPEFGVPVGFHGAPNETAGCESFSSYEPISVSGGRTEHLDALLCIPARPDLPGGESRRIKSPLGFLSVYVRVCGKETDE